MSECVGALVCYHHPLFMKLLYLWFISVRMLRGTVYRSRRSRPRKRRRYSSRRRTYRNYRRKRSRLSLDQTMTLIAVKNATSSKRQYGWIARDLGHLYPDVLAVKLYQSASVSLPNINHYTGILLVGGYRPMQDMTFGSPDSGYSVYDQTNPVGFDRLCGSDSTNSIYRLYCAISVAYDIRVALYPDISKVPAASTDTGFERQFPPWLHHLQHMNWQSVSGIGPSSTQPLIDVRRAQPQTRKQWTNGWSNGVHLGDPASSVAAYVPIEPRSVRWRGVAWAHRCLDVPFSSYLGDQSHWHVYNAGPSDSFLPVVKYDGAALGFNADGADLDNTAAATKHHVFITIDACYTYLFKQPHSHLI